MLHRKIISTIFILPLLLATQVVYANTSKTDKGKNDPTPLLCPLDVPGTTVKNETRPDAGAISFITKTGDVKDLRKRVTAMADRHNKMTPSNAERLMNKKGADNTKHVPAAASSSTEEKPQVTVGMIPSRATARDIDGGSMLILTPTSISQIEALRTALQQYTNTLTARTPGSTSPCDIDVSP